ncbi:MAG: DUF47 family protein [Bacteroidetes bacterium]|nr:DUF47 family protein [Bacteroidota bacterium]
MKLLQFLLPKDRVFFVLFEQIGKNILEITNLFQKFVLEKNLQEKEVIFKQMKQIERDNDDLTQQVSIELGRNFITPFDREDVHNLTNELDEIVNFIYATAKKMLFYQIDTTEEAVLVSIPPIVTSAEGVQEGILSLRQLKNSARMDKCLKKISKAEKVADELFYESIAELFEKTDDVKLLIKKREVYQYLESITDQCKLAGKVLGSISIKYA